jgi:hypothetical protein
MGGVFFSAGLRLCCCCKVCIFLDNYTCILLERRVASHRLLSFARISIFYATAPGTAEGDDGIDPCALLLLVYRNEVRLTDHANQNIALSQTRQYD